MKEDTEETPQQRSCPRGHSMRQHVFNANRVKYPMKRKSWQPGGGENSRGDESFERISWDEALDYVADELKRVYDNYGPRSVVCMGVDWPVLNLLGGRLQWNGVESYGTWYNAPIRMGTNISVAPDCMLGNDRLDMVNADTIVMYGINPAWHTAGNPIYYWRRAKDVGVEFVYVGPEYNVSASTLGARWIRVRPGTDTAFLLAVAYEMVRLDREEGDIVDWDFLHTYCVGFDEESSPEGATENFLDYILGSYDGQPKTPEWATEICATPTEDVTWYAREIRKTKNVMLWHSHAPARYRGSIDLGQLFLTVSCMGGHLGKSGNACGSTFSVESANGGTHKRLVTVGNASKTTSVKNPLERPHICKSDIWESIINGVYYNRGQYMNGEIDNGFLPQERIEFDPKIIVSDYHNPLQATEDINTGIKAFRKMDMVVCIDYRFTLTLQYADVVLPCITPWEGNLDKEQGPLVITSRRGTLGMTRNFINRDVAFFTRPAVQPLYEAQTDTWIYTGIAERLGVDPSEVFPISDVQVYFDKLAGSKVINEDGETYSDLVAITQEDLDAWDVEGEPHDGLLSLQEVLDRGIYIVPRSDGDNYGYIGYKDFVDDPEANPRPSESGKIEIYCQSKADAINGIGYASEELKPYPTFHETPYQQSFANWETKEPGQYPFLMFQPHYLRRSHTNFDESTWGREAYRNPIFMSAEDAEAKGIETGDTVWCSMTPGSFFVRPASPIS